jgi:hypothetical protein
MTWFTKKYIKYLDFNKKIYFKDSKPLETKYAKSTHAYCIYHHPCKGEIVNISKFFKMAPSAIHIKFQLSTTKYIINEALNGL